MKRWMLTAILAFAFMTSTAKAQMVTYLQEGEPSFSLTFPEGWEIRTPRAEGRNVISAYPSDGTLLWLGMWIMKESAGVDDAVERLKAMKAGLFEGMKTVREPWTEKLGALDARCFRGSGKYRGEKTVESFMALFELPGKRIGALGYIGEPDGVRTHRDDIEATLQSLEAVQ